MSRIREIQFPTSIVIVIVIVITHKPKNRPRNRISRVREIQFQNQLFSVYMAGYPTDVSHQSGNPFNLTVANYE